MNARRELISYKENMTSNLKYGYGRERIYDQKLYARVSRVARKVVDLDKMQDLPPKHVYFDSEKTIFVRE